MEAHHHYSVIPHEMAGSLQAMAGLSLSMSFTRGSAQKRGQCTHSHTLVCVRWSCDPGSSVFWICVRKYRNFKRLRTWVAGSACRLGGKEEPQHTSETDTLDIDTFLNYILYKGSKIIPKKMYFALIEVNNNHSHKNDC